MKTIHFNFLSYLIIFCLFPIGFFPTSVFGQVQGVGPNGFEIHVSKSTTKSNTELSKAFVSDIGKWWSKDHSWSDDAGNLSIDLERCAMIEKLPSGGFCRHLQLEHYEPGKLIRFTGALGPLKEMGLNGTMTIRFSAKDDKMVVDVKYVLHGYSKDGFERLAPVVHQVLDQQFGRLVNFVETGDP